MNRALITGISGQDGSYLAELLLQKGYEVSGLAREFTDLNYVPTEAKIVFGDLADAGSLKALAQQVVPDEVYNLGGVSDLKTAYAEPEKTQKINYENARIFLAECLKVNPKVHFLQASSSEIFLPSFSPLNENSARDRATSNPYARAKIMMDDFIAEKRRDLNAFLCSAILFNHESPRKSEKSAIRKITRTLAEVKLGLTEFLAVGNIEARRDWGFAGDYVSAMTGMLQKAGSEDFVLATGKCHSVKEVITVTAQALGLELLWYGEGLEAYATDSGGKKIVGVTSEFYRPTEENPQVGDASKAEKMLSWKPKVDFESLIQMMVEADINSLKIKK